MNEEFIVWNPSVTVDIDKLQNWYKQLKEERDPVVKTYDDKFGNKIFEPGSEGYGWSLHHVKFSRDEVQPFSTYEQLNVPMLRDVGTVEENGITRATEHLDYTKRTDCCFGYAEEILDFFDKSYKGVVWAFRPGYRVKKEYLVKTRPSINVVIAIETHDDITCNEMNKDFKMKADGSIWLWNSVYYSFNMRNEGSADGVYMAFRIPIDSVEKYRKMGEVVI